MATVTSNSRGGGSLNQGNLTITWVDPNEPPANPNITAPSINGLRTLATSSYTVSATVSAPPVGSTSTRIKVEYTTDSTFSSGVSTVYSSYRTTSGTCSVACTGLSIDKKYYIRVWAQGSSGLLSSGYDSANFYTDASPDAPTNCGPTGSTRSMGSVNFTASVSDIDGGTLNCTFVYSTDPSFTTFSSVGGSAISGSTVSVPATGLTLNSLYYAYAYVTDAQGATGPPTSFQFWTNRPPFTPTNTYPANGMAIDSTIPQTFFWTFSDPDTADSASNATLTVHDNVSYSETITVGNGSNSYTFPANHFPTTNPLFWSVVTYDQGGLASPSSTETQFTASAPVVNMRASTGMSIQGTDTQFGLVPMGANGIMLVNPSLAKNGSVAFQSAASLTIHPVSTIKIPVAMSTVAGMTVNPTHSVLGSVAMGAKASMQVIGTKGLNSFLPFAASGGILFQAVNGEVLMVSQAGMTIIPDTIANLSVVNILSQAGMSVFPAIEHDSALPFVAQAGLTINSPTVTIGAVIGMAANAAVSNSGGLSHLVPMVMGAQAQLNISDPDPIHPGTLAIASQAGMSIHGFNNLPGQVVMRATPGLVINPLNTESPAVAIGASAGLTVNAAVVVVRSVAMAATAGMLMPQNQYVFDGPYLVTTDSAGDTISFTKNSYPIPGAITNALTVSDSGNVAP
jgi:hypothetical protein